MVKGRRNLLEVVSDPAALAERGAKIFFDAALEGIKLRGKFYAALSGGRTPRSMHQLFAASPLLEKVPWDNTHLFWTDERLIPEFSQESNYGTAKKDFLNTCPIASGNVHPVPPGRSPEEIARQYERDILRAFEISRDQIPKFDLIFLGMGTDGHTASLFPSENGRGGDKRLILSVKGGFPNVPRVTFSLRVINFARKVVFLVSGVQKASIVKNIVENEHSAAPAAHVRPIDGSRLFLLDADAASSLSAKMELTTTGGMMAVRTGSEKLKI